MSLWGSWLWPLVLPSAPGWTSVMTTVGQWSGAVLSFLRITGSPGWMLWDERCQRWRCCSLWSSRQTTPSSSSGVVVDTCHLDNLLILMLKSMVGNWMSGSPIRKCPGEREERCGSMGRAQRGLLNQEVSRRKIGEWVIRKSTEGSGVETSFHLN